MKENKELRFLSILNPDEIGSFKEIPGKAICGFFVNDGFSPNDFKVNTEFIDILHNTIKKHGYGLESLKVAAGEQVNGYVYIIDLRTKDGVMGNVPPEDIIGAFKVSDGKIISNEYRPNNNYKVFTDSGLIQLPKDLKDKLIEDILK